MTKSPNSNAITPFLQTLAAAARRLPSQEQLQRYLIWPWISWSALPAPSMASIRPSPAPDCRIFPAGTRAAESVVHPGPENSVEYGIRHLQRPSGAAARLFQPAGLADSRAVVQRERHGTLLVDNERKLTYSARACRTASTWCLTQRFRRIAPAHSAGPKRSVANPIWSTPGNMTKASTRTCGRRSCVANRSARCSSIAARTELSVTKKRPSARSSDNKGHITHFVSTGKDITDRMRSDQEAWHTQHFQRRGREPAEHIACLAIAKELRFVRFNKAAEELLGYARAEMLGKNDYDFFPKNEADFFHRQTARC